jgi:helicase
LLALIATNEVYDDKSAWRFFEKTLYAKQQGSVAEIYEKILGIIDELEEFGFVKKGNVLECTRIGRRVSDLFLDPESAYKLIQALKDKRQFKEMSYLFAWANCYEFSPKFRLPRKINKEMWNEFNSRMKELPYKSESLLFEEDSLNTFYSALLLEKWINEKKEEELFKTYGLAPGTLFGKTRIIEWLAYSTIELSKVIGEERHIREAKKIGLRVKYGVKEELLSLVELKGIGRVRARKLFKAGIKTPNEVKKKIFEVEKLLGKKVAEGLKKQLKI